MRMLRRATLAAALGLATTAAITIQASSAAEATGSGELTPCTGTIKSVDLSARRVSLITGCGHSLRVVVLEADEKCRVEVGGVSVSLTSLRRGQIVTARYRAAAGQNIAESITTLPTTDARKHP